MLKNKNFEWMIDWREPDLPFDFMKDIYWMWTYNKIRSQGTQADVYRLAQLYDEASTNCLHFEGSGLNFNAWWNHAYACRKFIHEQQDSAWQEVIDRRDEEEHVAFESKLLDAGKEDVYCGVDWAKFDNELELLEAELEANGVDDPMRKTTKWDVTEDGHRVPKVPTYREVDQLNHVIYEFNIVNEHAHKYDEIGNRVEYTAQIKGVVYDKCNGYWMAVLWCEQDPDWIAENPQGYEFLCSRNLRGAFSLRQQLFDKIELLWMRSKSSNWKFGKKQGSVAKPKAQPVARQKVAKAPNIDKVKKALGVVDDICGDDLNGDIF